MGQFSNVLLTIDETYSTTENIYIYTLDCGPGLGGLNQVDGPVPLPVLRVSVASISTSLLDV